MIHRQVQPVPQQTLMYSSVTGYSNLAARVAGYSNASAYLPSPYVRLYYAIKTHLSRLYYAIPYYTILYTILNYTKRYSNLAARVAGYSNAVSTYLRSPYVRLYYAIPFYTILNYTMP